MNEKDKLETLIFAILQDEREKLATERDAGVKHASYQEVVEYNAKLVEVEYIMDRLKKELNIA